MVNGLFQGKIEIDFSGDGNVIKMAHGVGFVFKYMNVHIGGVVGKNAVVVA